MEADCENWKALFEETERTHTRDPHRLVQLATISNGVLLKQRHKKAALEKKKQQLVALRNSASTRPSLKYVRAELSTHRSTLLEEVHNAEVEQRHLQEKLESLEYALSLVRMKNEQMEETLQLYEGQQDELHTLTGRLHREKSVLSGEKTDVCRQIEALKHKQEMAVERLKMTRDETGEQCKLQLSTVRSPNIITLQKCKKSTLPSSSTFELLVEAVDRSEELVATRPCSKLQVKEMLRCLYVLSKLSNRTADIPYADILEKNQARMLSKTELIAYFEQKHFPIDQRFEELVCCRYHDLRDQLKSLEVQYRLQQELLEEREARLQQLDAEFRSYHSDREALEGLKLNEEQLKTLEIQVTLNESAIIKHIQFFYAFLGRMLRILGCVRLVAEGLVKEGPVQKKLVEMEERFQRNPLMVKLAQMPSLKQISKIADFGGGLPTNPELALVRNSRIVGMLLMAEHLSRQPQSPQADGAHQLIDRSHQYIAALQRIMGAACDELFQILREAVRPRRQALTSRTDRFKDAYCIESPDFYCRDNLKLIEKMENLKMKNIGTRRQLPAESELLVEKSQPKRKHASPEFSFLRRRNPLAAIKPPNSVHHRENGISQVLSKTCTNEFAGTTYPQAESPLAGTPHGNLLSERKCLEQRQNMSVRSMLGIVKKIGILDRSRTYRLHPRHP